MSTVQRASTTTVLRLGGVEAPVKLYNAIRDPKARSFEKASPNGKRLHTSKAAAVEAGAELSLKADPITGTPKGGKGKAAGGRFARGGKAGLPPAPFFEEGSGDEVAKDAAKRGIYRESNGNFVDLTAQLEDIAEAVKMERMEVIGFLAAGNVPRERIRGAYYLATGERGAPGVSPAKLLKVLLEALRLRSRVAVVRFTKRTGQSVGVITPGKRGALVVLELAFAENVLDPNTACLAHMRAEVSENEIRMAADLIDAMAAKRSTVDDVRDQRKAMEDALVVRAEAGELDEYEPEPPEADEGVEDISELLTTVTA